ncbi:hypothetical protein FJ425_26755 [Mesorhizobium sp. B2-7-2]|nr:hypothetical protein FJ425_26755 [Mesorhizobium sp. B2-7-2]
MRGVPGNANVSLRWSTPHPSRRCAATARPFAAQGVRSSKSQAIAFSSAHADRFSPHKGRRKKPRYTGR